MVNQVTNNKNMKNAILIFVAAMLSFGLFACKGDKAAKVMENAGSAVESVVESAVETVDETMEDMSEKVEEVAEDLMDDSEAEMNKIGSDELDEMKKAEAEVAEKPQLGTTNGANSDYIPKPTSGSTGSSATSSSTGGTNTSSTSKPSGSASTTTTTTTSTTTSGQGNSSNDSAVTDATSQVTTANSNPTPVLKGGSDKPKPSSSTQTTKVDKVTKPSSAGTSTTTNIGNAAATGVDHAAFNTLLSKFVSASGDVNYSGLKASNRALNAYCSSLSSNPPQDSWSRNEQLAYWLNAYNAFTLKLITENFPLNSITDLNGGKPWDKKWIEIGNQTLSLNGIENDIIRPRYNDGRIHFAVNCAAKSCPPLANYAFTAGNVNSKLEALTKSFVNSSANEISSGSINISKIFDWYKADFGNLVTFLNKYSNTKIDAGATVNYMDYDWSLNGK